jgi:hypothetical protein
VVGVPRTTVERLPALPTVAGDAEEVAKRLQLHGFDVWLQAQGLSIGSFGDAVVRLRDVTAPGDLGLIYFSGHGFRLSDDDGDDWETGWDQCLVLDDGLLRDDWWRTSFWIGTQPDTKWVTCVDSCFSASIMRGLGVDLPPLPIRPVAPRQGSWRLDLAAAPADESALQLTETSDGFGRAMAWMTAQLLRTLAAGSGTTYRALWQAVEGAARGHYLANVHVPLPQLRYSATDSMLLDSPAFAALDW